LKVLGSNGRWYDQDHPREIISPYILRYAEIRYWVREFRDNPAYGWCERGGKMALERSLGLSKDTLKNMLKAGWIWPSQQKGLTSRIRDILDGRIVPRRFGAARMEGVISDPPEPPQIVRPRTVKIAVQLGPLKLLAQDDRRPMRMPDLRDVFKNVRMFDPDKKAPSQGRRESTHREEKQTRLYPNLTRNTKRT